MVNTQNFEHFGKMDPSLRGFPLKSRPMSNDFLWKMAHFGSTSPYSVYVCTPSPETSSSCGITFIKQNLMWHLHLSNHNRRSVMQVDNIKMTFMMQFDFTSSPLNLWHYNRWGHHVRWHGNIILSCCMDNLLFVKQNLLWLWTFQDYIRSQHKILLWPL